ncbi:MAG: DUF1015 domain-containing protein [Armatimonadetes bacterium]|nr:DUF1015 domain-containing protein [Armatimonadota bacterium]
MAELKPFRAWHYNPEKVSLPQVLAPPYDVISPDERTQLQNSSPYNMIHLILGQSHVGSGLQADEAYAGAGDRWNAWRNERALVQDDEPAFYVYEQQFFLEGESYTRTGLAAAVKLEPFGNGAVYPHEKTFPGPKQDRLKLMESVNANLDSVFGMYDNGEADLREHLQRAKSGDPLLAGRSPDGQQHRVWAIRNPEAIRAIQETFAAASIVIADGHHRYETALNYRNEQRQRGNDAPELDYVMMTLCSIQDPGLLVLPTHRLVSGNEGETPVVLPGEGMAEVVTVSLSNSYNVQAVGSANHTMTRLSEVADEGKWGYGTYFGEDLGYLLTSKTHADHRYEEISRFSETILDRLPDILEVESIRVGYTHSGAEAVCQVNAGNAWIAYLLPGLPVAEVYEAARDGHLMPEKSTYFYPKLQSGLLMRSLEPHSDALSVEG